MLGIISVVAYLLLLILLIEWILLTHFVSSVIAYAMILLASFFVMHKWVFVSAEQRSKTFPKYLAVSLIGFGINTFGFYILVTKLNIWYLPSQIFLFVVVAFNNFLLNRYWSFRQGFTQE